MQLARLTPGPAAAGGDALAADAHAGAVGEDQVVGHHRCERVIQCIECGVVQGAHARQLQQFDVVDVARGARRFRGQRLQRGVQRGVQLCLQSVRERWLLLERQIERREAAFLGRGRSSGTAV